MDKFLADRKALYSFVLPALIVFAVIVIAPIFISADYSLLRWDGFGKGVFVGLQNFYDLFANPADGFPRAVVNSFLLAVLSVGVQLPAALLFALFLARGVRGETFYRTVYFIPVVLSTVVIGQLWMKIYHPSFGLLNLFLKTVGLQSWTRAWLGDTATALLAAFVPSIWQYFGYHLLLMYTAAKSVPDEIYEAARIDGASEARTAWHITIPLIMPILKVCVIFAVIGSLKSFDLIYILTGGGPVHASEVPSTLMFNTIFFKYMYGYGSAMAVFIIAECLALTLVIQKSFQVEEISY